jgi:hypothetical protein
MRSGARPSWEIMRRTHAVTGVVGWAILVSLIACIVSPAFRDLHLLGDHDWDLHQACIYYARTAILRFHQLPFWNPYTCGGYPAWASFAGDNAVTPPFLLAYLALALRVALRVEIVGSIVVSAVGAWLLAGRFTRSPAAQTFAAVLFVGTSRWALQVGAGQTWHMAFAWTPWVLYFLDRAIADWTSVPRWPTRDAALAGGCFAAMVYTGGIYPLGETMVAVVVYACVCSVLRRDGRPLLSLAAVAIVAFGLSAPKLLPLSAASARFFRPVDSPEAMDLGLFVTVLTADDKDVHTQALRAAISNWHEWGMYIGWIPVFLLLAGLIAARGVRARALAWTAVVLVALGFGSVHADAPWSLLHRLPVFRAQNLPGRWLYPALLAAATVSVAGAERVLVRAGPRRPWFEAAAIAFVAWLAFDLAQVARPRLENVFTRRPPHVQEVRDFHVEGKPPDVGGPEWASSPLAAMMANVGTTECAGVAPVVVDASERPGRNARPGVNGRGDPMYRGEAYIVEGVGRAVLTRFSPDEMTIEIDGARPGHHVVLDQSFDPGWRVNGRAALSWNGLVGATIERDHQSFVFRYRPPLWGPAIAVFALTVSGLAWAAWRTRGQRGWRAWWTARGDPSSLAELGELGPLRRARRGAGPGREIRLDNDAP